MHSIWRRKFILKYLQKYKSPAFFRKEMPKHYIELNVINKELTNGYNIRLQNYNEGVETMKKINAIIQKASRLRVGQRSSNMITYCRNTIKSNNIEGLIKIIRTGEL